MSTTATKCRFFETEVQKSWPNWKLWPKEIESYKAFPLPDSKLERDRKLHRCLIVIPSNRKDVQMSKTKQIADHIINPSPAEIEAECRMIRSHWSPRIQRERQSNYRMDSASQQAYANLRFLAEFADSKS